MKKVQYILLLGGLAVLLAPLMPYLQYALFQQQIEAYFCENKDLPELKCNGKCFLAKQIKAQHEAQKSENSSVFPVSPPAPEELNVLPFWYPTSDIAGLSLAKATVSVLEDLLAKDQFAVLPLTPPPRWPRQYSI